MKVAFIIQVSDFDVLIFVFSRNFYFGFVYNGITIIDIAGVVGSFMFFNFDA